MSELSHYIKLRNSAIGCNAKQFECDKYLDCDSCLEDKIKEHDKQIIEQYKADTNLKDTIKDIHDSVANEMYCKGVDDFVRKVKERQYILHILSDFMNCEDYGMFTVGIEEIAEELKAGGKNEMQE